MCSENIFYKNLELNTLPFKRLVDLNVAKSELIIQPEFNRQPTLWLHDLSFVCLRTKAFTWTEPWTYNLPTMSYNCWIKYIVYKRYNQLSTIKFSIQIPFQVLSDVMISTQILFNDVHTFCSIPETFERF